MFPISYPSWSYKSSVSHSFKSVQEQEDDEDDKLEESFSAFYNNTMRTQLLILDYKQFKAARTIQKIFRGWSVRKWMKKRVRAAIKIQRMWRSYLMLRNQLIVAEEEAQKSVLILYESSGVKIQALFRGWWSRKHVNNLVILKISQLNSVQDILYCIARKLHTMMRTKKLPGVASFCDSECLGKVEDLLMSMSYRMYNSYVTNKCLATKIQLTKNRENYKDAQFYTWAPFYGLDCDPPINSSKLLKTYDHIEQKLVDSIEEARRIIEKSKIIAAQKELKPPQVLSEKQKQFCEQMIRDINKWSVFQENNLNMSQSKMQVCISEFIDIVKGYLESFNYLENCYCKSDPKSCHPQT